MSDATRALVALLLVAGLAHAATPLSYANPATFGIALTPTGSVPLSLSASAGSGTSIGANATSASTSVNGGVITDAATNMTVATNGGTAGYRMRLVHLATTDGTAECVRCDVELRRGATTSAQIAIANGAVTQAQGDWVTVSAAGGSQSVWWIWAVARGSVVLDKTMTVSYRLEIQPEGAASPVVHYDGMVTAFRV